MKRLIAFVLLLAVGFYLLYELVGEEAIVPANASEQSASGQNASKQSEVGEAGSPRPRGNSGIGVGQGSVGATAEQRGELIFPKVRDVQQPDGTVVKEEVFVLHAMDSRPLRDGTQQLDDVEVTLFENGTPGAKLHAKQAIVELGKDANGDPSLAANKEISMTGVVFEALPNSKLDGLRLELDNARALVDDTELQIYTPTPDVPVKLTFSGERSATLTGLGLQARLPRDPSGALKRVDVNILSQPVLKTAGLVARARGLLHYAENTERQIAELSLTDTVEVEFEGDSRLSGTMRIRADQMHGWLARGDQLSANGETREHMAWRMLQLHGAPALVDLPEFRVSTPRLTILPGLNGMPFWITASGGISRIDQLLTPDKPGVSPVHGTSPRRIHLLRGREHFAANHRAFGFPQWALAPLDDFHVVAFEGQSHLEGGPRTVDASSGLHLFQTDARQSSVIARGFGDVTLQQEETVDRRSLRARGNDGFELIATKNREDLALGPEAAQDSAAWRNHRYVIEHGELTANGTGSCRLERDGEYAVVTLEAPDRDIVATMVRRGARLEDVRWLRAEFADQDVRTFDLAGVPAKARFERENETFFATAPRIEQTSAASLRMLPPDLEANTHRWHGLRDADRLPSLRREAAATEIRGKQSLHATAPRIDLHYMGNNQVLVDARSAGDVPARADATVERLGSETPVTIEFEAGRLRALPFAISPAAMKFHLGGRGDAFGTLPFFAERGPWIVGDDVHKVVVVDPDQGSFEGQARRMLLSTAAEACLLRGDSSTMTPASATQTTDGLTVTARGAQVRIFRDEAVHLQAFRAFPGRSAFLLPEVELHQPDRDDVLSHVIATCRGDIDVLPDAVLFRGPVVARSVATDGSTLPDGLGIVAESLSMDLHPETREVLRLLGRDVDLDWGRVAGHAAQIELDMRWSRIIAIDPDGARVELANGLVITGERVTVDHRTLAFGFYRGSVEARRAENR